MRQLLILRLAISGLLCIGGLLPVFAQIETPEPTATPRSGRLSRDRDTETRTGSSPRSRRLSDRDEQPDDPFEAFRVPSRKTEQPASRPAPRITRRESKSPSATSFRRERTAAPQQSGAGAGNQQQSQALPRMNIMFLEPGDQKVKLGQEFETALVFNNAKRETPDKLRAVLKYDPSLVMPMGAVKKPVEDLLVSPEAFDAKVFAEEGLVVVEASVKSFPTGGPRSWATVRWQTLAPTPQSEIHFVTRSDEPTAVFAGELNILGDSGTGIEGVIGAEFQIVGSDDAATGREELTESLVDAPYGTMYGAPASPSIGLHLVAPANPVRVGDSFFVDVFLDNAAGVQVDMVDLVINYDPSVLQVVDYDEQNWIEKGVNIFDGAYRRKYPFDVHLENKAENGMIRYRMGISRPDYVLTSGRMASILFKALRPARKASVEYVLGMDQPTASSVSHLGNELLNEQNVLNATVQVQ